MTLGMAHGGLPAAAIRQRFATGAIFRTCILAVTLLPLALALAMRFSPILVTFAPGAIQSLFANSLTTVFTWMGIVSAAHVASTAYLLFNPKEYTGVWKPRLTLIGAPLVLLSVNFVVITMLPLWAVMAYILVYVHYGM